MNLTTKGIAALNKVGKYSDGNGLSLEVTAKGRKIFFVRINIRGKDIRRNLGDFPKLSLSQARVQAILAREMLKESHGRSAYKIYLDDLLQEWLNKKEIEADANGKTYAKETKRCEKYLQPMLKNIPPDAITYQDILGMLKQIERKGKIEQMHRVKRLTLEFFRYVRANGYELKFNIAEMREDLSAALAKRGRVQHFATYTDKEDIKRFFIGVEAGTSKVTNALIKFHALTLTRPVEVRTAEWKDIDWGKELWTIPAEKMKMKREHLVPLSRQALLILQELREVTGTSKYLFPQARNWQAPVSDNTERMAMIKIADKLNLPPITAHGLRAMASTILNEHGFNADVIETALAHSAESANSIRAAYNRYTYLKERKEMLQWYADYLDDLTHAKKQ